MCSRPDGAIFEEGKTPSRGLKKTESPPFQLATKKSTARSLFTSVAIALRLGGPDARPVAAVTSVNVLFPLLRKRTFPAVEAWNVTSSPLTSKGEILVT